MLKPLSLLIAVAALSLTGCASVAGGAKVPTVVSQEPATQAVPAVSAAPGDPRMQEIQESHRKMLATTTPEERAAMMQQQKATTPGAMPIQDGKEAIAGGKMADLDAKSVDQQMQAMQQMHRKMQAAKTPKERAALKEEHMQAMQGCMSMMGRMKASMPMQGSKGVMPGGLMRAENNALMRRMDMMEMMMQMMMDRDAQQPASRMRK